MRIAELKAISSALHFAHPAASASIQAAEVEIGTRLPDELSEFLSESNGVAGTHALALVWPIQRIAADNVAFRRNAEFHKLYMPFEPLLFFGDAGNGDQFAYAITAGVVRRTDIFVWDHENDSRTWVAPCLLRYLEWFLNGTIRV